MALLLYNANKVNVYQSFIGNYICYSMMKVECVVFSQYIIMCSGRLKDILITFPHLSFIYSFIHKIIVCRSKRISVSNMICT